MHCTMHFHRQAVRIDRNACIPSARVSLAARAGQTPDSKQKRKQDRL
jgi:hypothetical protein